MIRIHLATEEHLSRLETTYDIHFRDNAEEEMDKAIALAEKEEVDAFVLITESGLTANHISKFRAPVPIIALTKSDIIQRSLSLNFGVYPLRIDFDASDDVTMKNGVELAQKIGLLKKGQKVMLLKDRANKMEIVTL